MITADMARTTRSFLISPDAARLEMSSAFDLPLQRHAMLGQTEKKDCSQGLHWLRIEPLWRFGNYSGGRRRWSF